MGGGAIAAIRAAPLQHDHKLPGHVHAAPYARSHHDAGDRVPNYRDLGRRDLTAAELRRRHRAWTERLLSTR